MGDLYLQRKQLYTIYSNMRVFEGYLLSGYSTSKLPRDQNIMVLMKYMDTPPY